DVELTAVTGSRPGIRAMAAHTNLVTVGGRPIGLHDYPPLDQFAPPCFIITTLLSQGCYATPLLPTHESLTDRLDSTLEVPHARSSPPHFRPALGHPHGPGHAAPQISQAIRGRHHLSGGRHHRLLEGAPRPALGAIPQRRAAETDASGAQRSAPHLHPRQP